MLILMGMALSFCFLQGCSPNASGDFLDEEPPDNSSELFSGGTPLPQHMAEASCFTSMDLVADEGEELGQMPLTSVIGCEQECQRRSDCMSIAVCPDYGKCWFKDKVVRPGMPLASS